MTSSFSTARPSRREAILLAGAAALAPLAGQAQAAEAILTKPIPSTGERLPIVGLGTNAYGVADPAELESRKAVLKRMPELGSTLVDTAASYGRSEEVIGALVKELGNRDKLFIASKFGATTAEAGRASVAESLRRLQTDHIDLMQAHNLAGVDPMMPVLQELKAGRTIRYIGVTTSLDRQHADLAAAMKKHRFDFVQVNYSIDDREAAETVLPVAQERGVAVLLNVPFGGRRSTLFSRVGGRPLPDLAAEVGATSWAQFFLKYSLSHPAVTCAIPGMTKTSYLEDNVGAARGRLPDAALRKKMEAYWDSLPA